MILGPVPQDLAAELEDLKRLLASQPVIEQSKGILMGRLGVGPDTAFQMLTRWSSHTNRKRQTSPTCSSPLLPASKAPILAEPSSR